MTNTTRKVVMRTINNNSIYEKVGGSRKWQIILIPVKGMESKTQNESE